MDLNVNESRNDTVIKILRSLPKVDASASFEDNLWRRINAESFESRYQEKETWWEKYLSPAKLIPVGGLALATVILLFIFNISNTETENPLVAAPKLRNDISVVAPQVNNIPPQKSIDAEVNSSLPSTTFTASVNKSGYNFLQVKLSNVEKVRISRLRERIRSYFNKNTR